MIISPNITIHTHGGGNAFPYAVFSEVLMASRRLFSPILLSFFLVFTLLSAISCSVLEPPHSTAIVLSLPGSARSVTADDVVRYEVSLSGAGYKATKSAGPGAQVEFSELAAGTYTLTALAFGDDGVQLAAGSAEATV